jgi:hypothetical protein
MTRTLELPDFVYSALLEAARAGGVEPVDWIVAKLPRAKPIHTEADRRAALDRLFSHTVDMGRPLGTDNEGIDADLARESLDAHEGP